MPGALELLSAVQDMRDHNGNAPALALVSDNPGFCCRFGISFP